MNSGKFDFGMVGLGVMGRNFALNVADNGFSVIGLDADAEKAAALENEAAAGNAKGTISVKEFVESLDSPRRIMLLVPAGKIVDAVIADLAPLLAPGDLIMDGGNSWFEDTDRRLDELERKGIGYLGVGVSGGSDGARHGPSIMPGGKRQAFDAVRPILEAVAAKVDGVPCVDFMGNRSAGHFVKMVHNGIEYALMQLLAEAYDLLKCVGHLSNKQLQQTFEQWNQGELQSFLVEITSEIFSQPDELAEGELIDRILDKAKQKGTGKWTSQHAMDLGIPTPTIDSAVTMRGISSFKQQRVATSELFTFATGSTAELSTKLSSKLSADELQKFVDEVGRALLFGFVVSYGQGLTLLAAASEEKGYELNLETCARIWRGGCIIRAALLEDIRQAFATVPKPENLIMAPIFRERLIDGQTACRSVVGTAIRYAIPTLALSSALNYFDAMRAERLPLNLVQAQRDYFGSHTYERTDREGIFHTEWASEKIASK